MLRELGSFILISTTLFCSFASGAETRDRARHRISFNDDGQVLNEAPTTGTSTFVKAWLDRETDTVPFTTFVFDSALPDICTYETKVGEVFAARFGPDFKREWAPAIRALRAEGTDALRVVTAHMRSKGKEVLAGIRMNDTHHRLDPQMPLCPQFALDHPEFVIRQPDGRPNESALDYSFPEVRQHRLAIMREIAEGYDVDGLELNFVRWAKHFPRDKGREKAPILTTFLKDIRQMLDAAARKRGRGRLTLGIRVPESVDTCWLAGIDINRWINSGWVDYVVVSTFNNTDPQVPVEEFVRLRKKPGVEILVSMGQMMGSISSGPPSILDRGIALAGRPENGYTSMLLTAPEARGAAANYYAWGADSVSFWNVNIHFGSAKTATPEQRERIRRWTHAVENRASVYAGPRVYRFLPMGKGIGSRKPPVRNYPWYDENHSPLGQPNSPVLQFTAEKIGQRLVFPFRMADGRKGEKLAGLLRFWVYHVTPGDRLEVDINGRKIPASLIKQLDAAERRGLVPGAQYEIRLADCPPLKGDNELGLVLSPASEPRITPYMEELEVTIGAPTPVSMLQNQQIVGER
ncbi:MAG: hypothetical protein ACE15E_02985 [Acidobacteriota bacterium]